MTTRTSEVADCENRDGDATAPRRRRPSQTEQVISCAQHCGDLTMPCPSGHFETCTGLPSSVMVSWTSSLPHDPHVMLPTLMPHFSHLYAAMRKVPSRSLLR